MRSVRRILRLFARVDQDRVRECYHTCIWGSGLRRKWPFWRIRRWGSAGRGRNLAWGSTYNVVCVWVHWGAARLLRTTHPGPGRTAACG